MTHQQCPSTKGKLPAEVASRVGAATGRPYWRSLEDYAQTAEFRDLVEREFPGGASELLETSRRDFVKLMGAGLALAGAATIPGCRRPDHKILPYSQHVPEEIIPGKPLFYATSMPLPGGGAEGLLVETHEGRPTKIEGNPLHPNNRGRSSAQAQASILELYDPDRLHGPVYVNPSRGEQPQATWDDFKHWAREHFGAYGSNGGAGLAFVAEPRSTPTWDAAKAALLERYPRARWVSYSPAGSDVFNAGSRLAFGRPMRELFDLSRARVIVSLDRDLTCDEPRAVANAREIGASRRVWKSSDEMSRIYAIEPMHSAFGTLADHHVRMAPSRIAAFAVALAKAVLAKRGDPGLRSAVDAAAITDAADFDRIPVATQGRTFIELLAEDLLAEGHLGRSVIAAGASLPAEVHALVHALNAALGNVGATVRYVEQTGDLAAPALSGLRALAGEMASGAVKTIVCLNVNPVYDAPADLDFHALYRSVPNRICLTVGSSETAAESSWRLNAAHWLESWGDTAGADGTVAPIQPMIAPLYDPAMNELELMAFLAGEEQPDAYEMVRSAWARVMGLRPMDGDFENLWRRALHDGVVPNSGAEAEAPAVRFAEVARAIGAMPLPGAPTASSLEVVFKTGPVGDGRYAGNAWLHELPHPITKVVWDNPVVVSPATAKALHLEPIPYTERQHPQARMATISVGGRSMKAPVWVCPGMADNVAIVTLGYGRTSVGDVGNGVGFNTYALRASDQSAFVRECRIERTGDTYPISSTQNHWSLEGRTALLRWLDKPAWAEHAAAAEAGPGGGRVSDPFSTGPDSELSIGEQLGELMHTPRNISIYENPYNRGRGNPDPSNIGPDGRPPAYATGHQWGMTVDLSSCTGCGACIVACQSENNIPTVGKQEVAKGREMHWIRIDRYFGGDSAESPDRMLNQFVACVHCENAPCETVCPVNATVHDERGLNVMVYNRCIGTRYCMNNCPYKARRFNFFDWGQTKLNGGLDPKYVPEAVRDATGNGGQAERFNQHLIPPRLRAKLDEIQKMKHNPDVTIRGRGVMEKCTFCIQRVNSARAEANVQGLETIPDGFVQVACQQACPTESIVFGNILDPDSAVSRTRTNQRSYLLLGYLATRPRTNHLIRVNNPNPAILAPVDALASHAHGGAEGHGDEEGHGGAPADDGHQTGEGAHSFRVDPRRRARDEGYALSLKVLGTGVQHA
ncbi:MAG TPA: TAT-variant-translocated molybdopterin oxidoreductase [Phycisphaerales bacterium]|nr:TAT-variant-translocated molybdopterin oxidoreductase [Phycisphaerales bacterium]